MRTTDSEAKNMQIKKQVVTHLTKCYSLAETEYAGETAYLVASEKQYPCIVASTDGRILDKVWDGPGGVMTMETLEDGSGAFLATHRFYSPNDSARASIVLAQPVADKWSVRTLCSLPFVHRFGILKRDGKRYVVAATLKSAHAFKDDWTCPGKVWVGQLPEDLSEISEENPLELSPLISGLYRNHGFFKYEENGHTECLIGADNGIYKVTPPDVGGEWQYEQIFSDPASDMLYADFDGDGEKELLVFSPFHGETLTVYKSCNGCFEAVYRVDHPLPFLHALAPCRWNGRDAAVVGHRKGARDLLMISCQNGVYRCDAIDHNVGSANVLCCARDDQLWVLSANREIDEVAMYTVSP